MLNVSKRKPRWFELGLMGLLVALDQWSKWFFQQGQGEVIANPGGVLGVWPDFGWFGGLLIVWVIMFWQWWCQDQATYRWGLLLILAGGLGNLLDRARFGWVRDFIYYPGFGFYGNVADIALVIGVMVAIGSHLVKSGDEHNSNNTV